MIDSTKSAVALAATAAALMLAGAVAAPTFAAKEMKGQCIGANACKGHGSCKSAANACKGLNACKGKGFVEMTKAECAKITGAKFELPKKS